MLLIEDLNVHENEEKWEKPAEDFVAIPLDPNNPKKVTYIGVSLVSPLKEKLIKFFVVFQK